MTKMITEFDKLLNQKNRAAKVGYRIKKRSILMSGARSVIFEYLCHRPCSSVTSIAKALKSSESSVRWHLDKLVYERFVSVNDDGNTVFSPSNMIDPEHIKIFRGLALERSRAILALIEAKEGLNQSELCSKLGLNLRTVVKYASDLESLGLLRSTSDGKYSRYYPTSLMNDLKDHYRKNARHFKDYIVNRTRRDGLRPKIITSTPELLRLRLTAGAHSRILTIPMIPFGGDEYGLRNIRKERTGSKSGTKAPTSQIQIYDRPSCAEAFKRITS